MGHLSFEAKDLFEHTTTSLPTFIEVPLLTFFVPQHVISVNHNQVTILDSPLSLEELMEAVDRSPQPEVIPPSKSHGYFAIEKSRYISDVGHLIDHIHRGDIYEINYCQPYHIEDIYLRIIHFYQQLRDISGPPFGAMYRHENLYLASASPERFVAKRGRKLIVQPIKGTNRRLVDDTENKNQQRLLRESQKERSENVMIVDLMRNDLSKICVPSSVTVEELFGIYAFKHVNQMISTVVGETMTDIDLADAMEALFPMGSMTGAPKIEALKLTDRYESFARGLYSGTVGYIDPSGDWDFNVIIRSLIYDDTTRKAALWAGGAITALSDPFAEYEESILKMESILQLISSKIVS